MLSREGTPGHCRFGARAAWPIDDAFITFLYLRMQSRFFSFCSRSSFRGKRGLFRSAGQARLGCPKARTKSEGFVPVVPAAVVSTSSASALEASLERPCRLKGIRGERPALPSKRPAGLRVTSPPVARQCDGVGESKSGCAAACGLHLLNDPPPSCPLAAPSLPAGRR